MKNSKTILNFLKWFLYWSFKKTFYPFIFIWENKFYWVYKDKIIREIQGNCAFTKKICIFSLYQPKGIPDYLLVYLKEIQSMGFSILLVSTSTISDKDLDRLKPYCCQIIIKHNFGYDFGSYRYGILSVLNKRDVEEILIANDSVFGPFHPLKPIYERMKKAKVDAWGMLDAEFPNYHMPSYFILFKKSIVQDQFFKNFWHNYKPFETKEYVIKYGEIKISKVLLEENFIIGCAFSKKDIIKKTKDGRSKKFQSLNFFKKKKFHRLFKTFDNDFIELSDEDFIKLLRYPIILWDILNEIGFPFLKRDLVYKVGVKVDLIVKSSTDLNFFEIKHLLAKR